MNGDGLNKVRVALINIGKSLPFIVCFVVLISYSESCYALFVQDFVLYDGSYVLNKPISWFLGSIFEYNIQLLVVITVLSFAIRTCIYNKLSLLYLYINLWEKSYFISVNLYVEQIYMVIVLNVITSGFFVYKGIKLVTQKVIICTFCVKLVLNAK